MAEPSDTEDREYDDDVVFCFGLMDPCEWAAELSAKLSAASSELKAARTHYIDPSKEIIDTTDEEALARVRSGVQQYLAEIFLMFQAMPLFQRQPKTMEALQFILAGIADIDRGAPPTWLVNPATKRHPKRLELEAEWVPIIAALELHLFILEKPTHDAAAKAIRERTGRAVSTINGWHKRLFRAPESRHAAAKIAIQECLDEIRAVIAVLPNEHRYAIVQRRIDELLHQS